VSEPVFSAAMSKEKSSGLIRSPSTDLVESGYRSTGFKPLVLLLLILAPSTVAAFFLHVPSLFSIPLGFLTSLSIVVFLVSYVYWAFTNPAMLRSERYARQHLTRENGGNLGGSLDTKQLGEGQQTPVASPQVSSITTEA